MFLLVLTPSKLVQLLNMTKLARLTLLNIKETGLGLNHNDNLMLSCGHPGYQHTSGERERTTMPFNDDKLLSGSLAVSEEANHPLLS